MEENSARVATKADGDSEPYSMTAGGQWFHSAETLAPDDDAVNWHKESNFDSHKLSKKFWRLTGAGRSRK